MTLFTEVILIILASCAVGIWFEIKRQEEELNDHED